MKMHEKKLKRFNVYGQIAKVLFILTIILGALATLGSLTASIIINTIDFDLVYAVNFVLDYALPGSQLVLPEDVVISYGILYIAVLQIALSFAFTAYIMKSVANMFLHTTKSETPFTENTVKSIRNVGIAFLIYTGVLVLVSIVSGAIFPIGDFSIDVNIKMGVIGLLVLAIGEMFDFGMTLQEDSESIL